MAEKQVLPEPSPELAVKLLSEVGFEERLVGYEMSPATGQTPRSLYSLAEVARFVGVGGAVELLTRGSQASIGYLDPEAVIRWVETILGDAALASALRRKLAGCATYREKAGVVHELLQQRLAQCQAVLSTPV